MSATSIYRQIWIDHNGPIPYDEQGRSFEIHHINGNHDDNRLENLQCVSIQEHYDIHLRQCDYAACILLAERMNKSGEELSRLSKANAELRVKSGTHPWLNANIEKKECEWCHKMSKPSNYAQFHGDYCLKNPNALPRKPYKPREKKQCEWCNETHIPGNYEKYHGKYCKQNPNAIPYKPHKPYKKKECPWCHEMHIHMNYVRYHGYNCKEKHLDGPRRSS